MPDRLFFPLALITAAALIASALAPAVYRKPSGSVSFSQEEFDAGFQRLVIEGDELYKLIAGGESIIEIDEAAGTALISAKAATLALAPELGPHFRLAADVENVLANRRIRVTVEAKPADRRGAENIMLNYSAGRMGESDWIVRQLMPDWIEVSFEYNVPAKGTDENAVDFLGIRPVVPDKDRAVLIRRVVIEPLGPHS